VVVVKKKEFRSLTYQEVVGCRYCFFRILKICLLLNIAAIVRRHFSLSESAIIEIYRD
jgi:hypothetical protein